MYNVSAAHILKSYRSNIKNNFIILIVQNLIVNVVVLLKHYQI